MVVPMSEENKMSDLPPDPVDVWTIPFVETDPSKMTEDVQSELMVDDIVIKVGGARAGDGSMVAALIFNFRRNSAFPENVKVMVPIAFLSRDPKQLRGLGLILRDGCNRAAKLLEEGA